jgi:hypothetical protein
MALYCIFINIIIPIPNIDRIYEGGFEKFKVDVIEKFGGKYYYDEYLFHDGAMNPGEIEHIIEKWEKLGLIVTEEVDGEEKFKDLCVVEGGPTLPCDWLEFDPETNSVWLKGKPKGEIVGPKLVKNEFVEKSLINNKKGINIKRHRAEIYIYDKENPEELLMRIHTVLSDEELEFMDKKMAEGMSQGDAYHLMQEKFRSDEMKIMV